MKTNTNKTSELQNRPEPLSTNKTSLAKINFARRMANRALNTDSLLAVLRNQSPRFFELAEVVGQWVWIQFREQPAVPMRQQLAELGFHWNNVRQAWQHPCGLYRDRRVAFDPRKKYGSYFAADVKLA